MAETSLHTGDKNGLPVYTEYPTQLPADFPIGVHKTTPLVDVTELQAHLRLLGAIKKLEDDVKAQADGVAATNKDLAWVVFVNKAVYRFYSWASAVWPLLPPGSNEVMIPPLDVIMVWHTYLLNPRAYYEDSIRMVQPFNVNLVKLENMPLTLISALIDPQSFDPTPAISGRIEFFERTSEQFFQYTITIEHSDVIPTPISCPRCSAPNYLVNWIAPDDKGFAQPHFRHLCENLGCGKSFNKREIGVKRFCDEVTLRRTGQVVFLPETLLVPLTGLASHEKGKESTDKILAYLDKRHQVLQPIPLTEVPAQSKFLAGELKYSHLVLSDSLHLGLRPQVVPDRKRALPILQRIPVAYIHGGLASLDLVGAILRQGSFVSKMVDMGWTRTERFDKAHDLAPLVRSVARYHAFLDLMSQNPSTFLVPTLDIDLAWHTHQLKGAQYRTDTIQYLERTPNHDDSVEAYSLSTGYDITAKAWKARFGVPYSVCGCVPDPDAESPLSRFASKITNIGSKKEKIDPNGPIPAPINNRPDLVTTELTEADSSHPSEHNLQWAEGSGDPNNASAKLRRGEREKHSQKCTEKAKKAAHKDPWRALQAERNEKKREGHQEAFTDPYMGYGYYYPYWGVSAAIPFGFYGGYAAGGVGGCGSGGGGGCGGGCGGCGGCGGWGRG